jgi:hypothetical protein
MQYIFFVQYAAHLLLKGFPLLSVSSSSTGGTRQFQYWNSRVPLLELKNSTSGTQEFHQWNSTLRLCVEAFVTVKFVRHFSTQSPRLCVEREERDGMQLSVLGIKMYCMQCLL